MLHRVITVFAVFIGSCLTTVGAVEPLRIGVLSYNIHHGEGIDGKLDLRRIAGVIRSVSPDIVALQEVDRRTARTDRVDQPAELARLTEMEVVFEKNIDYQGGQYGNAVLSNVPVARHENIHLPRLDNGEQRGVLMVELQPETMARPVLLLATHLDHRPDDRERFASAEQINRTVEKHAGIPAILAGDLNDTRGSRVLKKFEECWTVAGTEELPTIPVGEPTRQIDFILYRPRDDWRVVEVRVLDEAIASDHRAVFATLELLPRS
jgi:endonuclease/exonuclease/phosphatase family metal-dependent hydrolase